MAKTWASRAPVNLISQKPYRGLNVISLASQGYASEYWLTFNQCNRLGGKNGKGEHGSLVVFWSIGEEKINAKTGKLSKPVLLRYCSTSINLQQTEGIAEKLGLDKQTPRVADIEAADAMVAKMPNVPRFERSDKAWYSSSRVMSWAFRRKSPSFPVKLSHRFGFTNWRILPAMRRG